MSELAKINGSDPLDLSISFNQTKIVTSMNKKSDLLIKCEETLQSFIEPFNDWKYVKSRGSFVKKISKNASIELYTGMSAKVDFVNFQFSLMVTHKALTKIEGISNPNGWAIILPRQTWIPSDGYNSGR